MVARGFAGAAALAMALASVGAFAPGSAFVRSPMNPSSYGIDRIVNMEGSVVISDKVRWSGCEQATALLETVHSVTDLVDVIYESETLKQVGTGSRTYVSVTN